MNRRMDFLSDLGFDLDDVDGLKKLLSPEVTLSDFLDELEYQESLKRRELFLHDEVNFASVSPLISQIQTYNRDDLGKPINERKPIFLHIYSGGGDVFSGNSLVSIIEASKTPIYTVNDGFAASMAGKIFIAGHIRYAIRNAVLMLHDGALAIEGDASKVEDFMDFNREAKERDESFTLQRSTLSLEEYRNHLRDDWYMFPEYAKERGMVDIIIGEDCELDEILPT